MAYLLGVEAHSVGASLEDSIVNQRVDIIVVLVEQAAETCLASG